jgi:hypothetical protein
MKMEKFDGTDYAIFTNADYIKRNIRRLNVYLNYLLQTVHSLAFGLGQLLAVAINVCVCCLRVICFPRVSPSARNPHTGNRDKLSATARVSFYPTRPV